MRHAKPARIANVLFDRILVANDFLVEVSDSLGRRAGQGVGGSEVVGVNANVLVVASGSGALVINDVPNTNRMVFYRISALRDLSTGAYGILEPKEAEAYQDEANALCLVPGLAFSADGARLGYGKGYYDTFFARHPVLKLGLCYDFQLVPQVPTQPHDVRMDGILTDKRLVLTADEERME